MILERARKWQFAVASYEVRQRSLSCSSRSTAQQGSGFYIIYDSSATLAGSSGAVQLSTGWTALLRGEPASLLTATASSIIEPLLDRSYNKSVTWTTVSGANLNVSFTVTSVYAYGLAGPDGPSSFSVPMDGRDMGSYTARTATVDPLHLLFAAYDLPEGKHVVTFVNRQERGILAFDYADVTGTQPEASDLSASLTTLSVSSSGSTRSTSAQSSTSATATVGMPTAASLAAATDPSVLRAPYVFEWNAAARFVIVLACLFHSGKRPCLAVFLRHSQTLASEWPAETGWEDARLGAA